MTDHALTGEVTALALAGEVRAELARQKKSAGQLAEALRMTPHTAGRRLSGDVAFSVPELFNAAQWLGVPATELVARAEGSIHQQSKAVA